MDSCIAIPCRMQQANGKNDKSDTFQSVWQSNSPVVQSSLWNSILMNYKLLLKVSKISHSSAGRSIEFKTLLKRLVFSK